MAGPIEVMSDFEWSDLVGEAGNGAAGRARGGNEEGQSLPTNPWSFPSSCISGFSCLNPLPMTHKCFKRPSECLWTPKRGRHGWREGGGYGKPLGKNLGLEFTVTAITKIPNVTLVLLGKSLFLQD